MSLNAVQVLPNPRSSPIVETRFTRSKKLLQRAVNGALVEFLIAFAIGGTGHLGSVVFCPTKSR